MKVINNSDVARLVSQDEVTRTLETAYQDLFSGKAVCRPRVDVEIPSSDPDRFYRWGTMEEVAPVGILLSVANPT